MEVKKILSIAGSDSSGGAGIQADLKTIQAHGMFGMSAITSVTAQNTTGVYGVYDVTPEFVGKQIDAVFEDIYPDAVKIGMVSNIEIIRVIADRLRKYKPKVIVADPVMVSTSGYMLIEDSAKEVLVSELLPLADIITPNIPETEVLSSRKIDTKEDMLNAAKLISKINHKAVLVKGGHLSSSADDLLYCNHYGNHHENVFSSGDRGEYKWFEAKRIDNDNTHGTGCTLSSAIACELAAGKEIFEAVEAAKDYVYNAINVKLNLGKGSGPLWHNV